MLNADSDIVQCKIYKDPLMYHPVQGRHIEELLSEAQPSETSSNPIEHEESAHNNLVNYEGAHIEYKYVS